MKSLSYQLTGSFRNKAKSLTSPQIEKMVRSVGGGRVSAFRSLMRAELVAEYEHREGRAATDALMQQIGLPFSDGGRFR